MSKENSEAQMLWGKKNEDNGLDKVTDYQGFLI